MGAIKDCVDLFEKLDNSIKDRKTLELLFPLKVNLLGAKEEYLELKEELLEFKDKAFHAEHDAKEKIFGMEQQFKTEMSDLRVENNELKDKIVKLSTENHRFKSTNEHLRRNIKH